MNKTKQGVRDLNHLQGRRNKRYAELAEELAANESAQSDAQDQSKRSRRN